MPGTPPPPTPEQQRLIERIAAQREHLRTLRRTPPDRVDPADPLVLRLWHFARLHPAVTAAALAALALTGSRRLSRWAGVMLPIVLQMRR
ncbi:MAG: hypothetical protein LT082_00935 [Comamonas sp.]|jgi:hypothetical protein|nr:hypothetical protein [Comamonas sp.]